MLTGSSRPWTRMLSSSRQVNPLAAHSNVLLAAMIAVPKYLLAGYFALLGADRHGSAADRFAPARLQITEHDPVMGAETDDLTRIDIVHELNAWHAALDLLDHGRRRLRRSRHDQCPGALQQDAENGLHRICSSTIIAARRNSVRRLDDLSRAGDVPMFADKRFAGEPVGEPVGKQNRRKRSEIGSRHIADGMARFLIDHHLLRALERGHQTLGMFERTELFRFAGDAQIGYPDLVCVSFPGDGLAKRVELVLVGDAAHIHESFFESRRGFLKNGLAARLVAH